jgi:polyisoprenoid-binding protein YceI
VKKLVAAVLALAVVVALAAYWFVFRDTAPPPAALPSRAIVNGTQAVDGTWRVQPGQGVFVGYRVHELFGGDAISRVVAGRTGAVTGSMVVSGSRALRVTVSANLAELTSDQARRDRYIRTHGLETATVPTSTFVLTHPLDLGGKPIAGKVVSLVAKGTFTLHGVARSVAVPLQARWNGSTIDVSGSLPITFADYHITPPNIGGFVAVDGAGQFELQLTFVKV